LKGSAEKCLDRSADRVWRSPARFLGSAGLFDTRTCVALSIAPRARLFWFFSEPVQSRADRIFRRRPDCHGNISVALAGRNRDYRSDALFSFQSAALAHFVLLDSAAPLAVSPQDR